MLLTRSLDAELSGVLILRHKANLNPSLVFVRDNALSRGGSFVDSRHDDQVKAFKWAHPPRQTTHRYGLGTCDIERGRSFSHEANMKKRTLAYHTLLTQLMVPPIATGYLTSSFYLVYTEMAYRPRLSPPRCLAFTLCHEILMLSLLLRPANHGSVVEAVHARVLSMLCRQDPVLSVNSQRIVCLRSPPTVLVKASRQSRVQWFVLSCVLHRDVNWSRLDRLSCPTWVIRSCPMTPWNAGARERESGSLSRTLFDRRRRWMQTVIRWRARTSWTMRRKVQASGKHTLARCVAYPRTRILLY